MSFRTKAARHRSFLPNLERIRDETAPVRRGANEGASIRCQRQCDTVGRDIAGVVRAKGIQKTITCAGRGRQRAGSERFRRLRLSAKPGDGTGARSTKKLDFFMEPFQHGWMRSTRGREPGSGTSTVPSVALRCRTGVSRRKKWPGLLVAVICCIPRRCDIAFACRSDGRSADSGHSACRCP